MTLIDKQAALDAIERAAQDNMADANHNYLAGFRDAAEAVENVPAVGQRGRWKRTKTKMSPYQCDRCGKYSDYHYDFCPRCLADMRASVTALMEGEWEKRLIR